MPNDNNLSRQLKLALTNLNKMSQDLLILNSTIRNQHEKIIEQSATLSKIHNSRLWKIMSLYKQTKTKLKQLIPIGLRKKIKSLAKQLISSQQNNDISPDLQAELSSWLSLRHQSSYDLLNFSVIGWDFRVQRPQHLATKIAAMNHRVFYIENEFLNHHQTNPGFAPVKIVRTTSPHVYLVNLSAHRNLFIYQDRPTKKDREIIKQSIKTLIKQANIINPIAKVDHPFWQEIVSELSLPYIYDCMDNHQGFSENSPHLSQLEQKLFQQAEATIVTSKYLHALAKKSSAKRTVLIPNAADYSHFATAAKPIYPPPLDIASIPHPIIGYYGAISDWFDAGILNTIAQDHPDKSIVLIGQVTNRQVEYLSSKHKNIYLLGEKKYLELPQYLSHFDVCLIPFIINELIKATHPVKVYEYLAANKPIVSTRLPEIKDLRNQIYFATPENFSATISRALSSPKNHDLQLVAQQNTWEMRAQELNQTINQILFPKTSIIILSFNSPELIRQTLDSVLAYSFHPQLEVIVVDNNSTTETVSLLQAYQDRVKIIFNSKNYGFAKGNNLGLKKATGDYLVLLNNDVIVTPGWLGRLLFHLRHQPEIGLVGPVTNSIGNEAKIDINYRPSDINDIFKQAREYTASHWGETLELRNIAAFCWIMSRQTYQKIGGLDEQFGKGMFEDDDYCRRIIDSGKKILISDDVFIHHFGGASFKQLQSVEYQKIFEENKKKFEEKWHSKWVPHQYRH